MRWLVFFWGRGMVPSADETRLGSWLRGKSAHAHIFQKNNKIFCLSDLNALNLQPLIYAGKVFTGIYPYHGKSQVSDQKNSLR